jgi:hypothetical protein
MAVAEILHELTNDDRSLGMIDLRPCYFALLGGATDEQVTLWAENPDELMIDMREPIVEDPIALDASDREEDWDAVEIDLVADLSASLGIPEGEDPVELSRRWLAEYMSSDFAIQRSVELVPVLEAQLSDLRRSFGLDNDPTLLSNAFCNLLKVPGALAAIGNALTADQDAELRQILS